MPIYEYSCSKCGKTIEVIQKFSDPVLKKHKDCGGNLTKLVSAAGFQFKGTGWYVTDYARKGTGGDSEAPAETKDRAETKDKKEAPAKTGTASKESKKAGKSGKASD